VRGRRGTKKQGIDETDDLPLLEPQVFDLKPEALQSRFLKRCPREGTVLESDPVVLHGDSLVRKESIDERRVAEEYLESI
jgi:hypothetical protein